MVTPNVHESEVSFSFPAIRAEQPLGAFFVASVPHWRLFDICYFDVRRMLKERDIEEYLGIQRPLSEARATELKQYVRTLDACFPTSIVLAVNGRCAKFENGQLTLSNYPSEDADEQVLYKQIAKVLDGQHRIAGLEGLPRDFNFDLNVSIFIDIELQDQAYLFSVVNLAQTKVHKSLAYDLFELANSRSPQKTAHNISVALDRSQSSPLHKRIKRLGSATPGRSGTEVLTQSTVVEGILPLISRTPMVDRDILKRKKTIDLPNPSELERMPLRGLFAQEKDVQIYNLIEAYFQAVAQRWPTAWGDTSSVLARTNGYRALMRVFPRMYRWLAKPGSPVLMEAFLEKLKFVSLEDGEFTVETFKPGTSGEAGLANRIIDALAAKGMK